MQVPRQLFQQPHPSRQPRLLPKATHRLFAPDLHIENAANALLQSVVPVVSAATGPVQHVAAPPHHAAPDRVRVRSFGSLQLLQHPQLEFSYADCTGLLRLQECGSGKPITTFEGGHTAAITATCFMDADRLVTASAE